MKDKFRAIYDDVFHRRRTIATVEELVEEVWAIVKDAPTDWLERNQYQARDTDLDYWCFSKLSEVTGLRGWKKEILRRIDAEFIRRRDEERNKVRVAHRSHLDKMPIAPGGAWRYENE